MPDRPAQLRLEKRLPDVLPEIVRLLEEMVRMYNEFDGSAYLKLPTEEIGTSESPTNSRYQLYDSKHQLYQAIMSNCPAGCTIILE